MNTCTYITREIYCPAFHQSIDRRHRHRSSLSLLIGICSCLSLPHMEHFLKAPMDVYYYNLHWIFWLSCRVCCFCRQSSDFFFSTNLPPWAFETSIFLHCDGVDFANQITYCKAVERNSSSKQQQAIYEVRLLTFTVAPDQFQAATTLRIGSPVEHIQYGTFCVQYMTPPFIFYIHVPLQGTPLEQRQHADMPAKRGLSLE